MPNVRTAGLRIAALLVYLCSFSEVVHAATPLAALWFSPDITLPLGSIIVTPADVAVDHLNDTVTFADIGSFPQDAHVDAYHLLPNGDRLLSFDTTMALGGITATPADVVRFNGVIYTLEFDAAANGVPEGVNTDAIAIDGGKLLLSFDISVSLSGTRFEDEDLVEFVGPGGGFVPYFNGAAAGVPSELDVDGAQVLGPMHLLLSFDGSGRIGGVNFDDEDVLEYTGPGAGTWELAYDGSSLHAGMDAADLVGLFAVVAAPTAVPTTSDTPTATPTPTVAATAVPTSTAQVAPTETPPAVPTNTEGPPVSTATSAPTTVAEATSTPSPIGTPAVGPTSTPGPCIGDCNGSGEVTVNELLVMVNIALGNAQVSDCLAGDGNGSGEITIDEILLAVNHALTGC